MLLCYEISPLLLELPPCGQVQVIVLSVQVVRERPCLTVSSRSLWYVTGWGCIICMLHSFTWIFMLCYFNETNSFETFCGACVPNVLWIISIFPLLYFEVIPLNYYLTVYGLSFMWYPVAMFAYSDKCFYEIFMLGKRGVTTALQAWVSGQGEVMNFFALDAKAKWWISLEGTRTTLRSSLPGVMTGHFALFLACFSVIFNRF